MKLSFLYRSFAVVLALSFFINQGFSQEKQSGKATIASDFVNERQFTFVPQSATPLGGRYIVLNYDFSFKINGDSIVSYLPYYGRAFVAQYNPTEGPLTFTSTDFNYNINKSDGKKQELVIETKDRTYNNKFFFTIFNDGTASLQVTSTDRQPIIYQGRVSGLQAMK
jgi:hypothetical protein